MYRRKIQLVAGMTYSISLPKEWVQKNNLKEKQELLLYEKDDRSLVVTKDLHKEGQGNNISINADEYGEIIDVALFKLYYLGFETIDIVSKKEISKEVKSKIRNARQYMSGAEITYADPSKMTIKVFLDRAKFDFVQLLYRVSLILDQSMTCLQNEISLEEMDVNEKEIDRLYHLMNKILSISLMDSTVLQTAKVKNVHLIPSYILIAKKLENMADEFFEVAQYVEKNPKLWQGVEKKKYGAVLQFFREELQRTMRHILADYKDVFSRGEKGKLERVGKEITQMKDFQIREHFSYCLRYLIDVEDQIIGSSFYKKLVREKLV